jgi:Zn-dependent membrane protease YugP
MLYYTSMVVLVPAFILVMWASHKVRSTYAKYSKVPVKSGMTGAEMAAMLLRREGIGDVQASAALPQGAGGAGVRVRMVQGQLNDNYNPRDRTVSLSPEVHSGSSVAALGVAAHEVGHAIQHARGYSPLALRSSLIPLGNFGQYLGPLIFIVGFLFAGRGPTSVTLMNVGILLFSAGLAVILVTLPVEFNASRRAVVALRESGMVTAEEEDGVRRVLTAAALTYVAAAAMMLAHLLRLIILRNARS